MVNASLLHVFINSSPALLFSLGHSHWKHFGLVCTARSAIDTIQYKVLQCVKVTYLSVNAHRSEFARRKFHLILNLSNDVLFV